MNLTQPNALLPKPQGLCIQLGETYEPVSSSDGWSIGTDCFLGPD